MDLPNPSYVGLVIGDIINPKVIIYIRGMLP
jgi:hypothetical protein